MNEWSGSATSLLLFPCSHWPIFHFLALIRVFYFTLLWKVLNLVLDLTQRWAWTTHPLRSPVWLVSFTFGSTLGQQIVLHNIFTRLILIYFDFSLDTCPTPTWHAIVLPWTDESFLGRFLTVLTDHLRLRTLSRIHGTRNCETSWRDKVESETGCRVTRTIPTTNREAWIPGFSTFGWGCSGVCEGPSKGSFGRWLAGSLWKGWLTRSDALSLHHLHHVYIPSAGWYTGVLTFLNTDEGKKSQGRTNALLIVRVKLKVQKHGRIHLVPVPLLGRFSKPGRWTMPWW